MGGHTATMPKKKTSTEQPAQSRTDESYRRRFKPARIRDSLATIATERAANLAQDFTQYVNDAVRMRLEAEGVWPPPPPAPKR